jgi:glutamate-1-semialdehyde 2,1-aminomutase
MQGLEHAFQAAGVPALVTGLPQMLHVALETKTPPRDYRDTTKANKKRYVAFTTAMLRRGVRALERGTWFMSSVHDDEVINDTIAAAKDAAREI